MQINPLPVAEPVLFIDSATAEDSGARVVWNDGHTSFFHYVWLRDCCYCSDCGDCYSSKRFFVPCDTSLDIRPRDISVGSDGSLRVEWLPDGHLSRYDAEWLRRHCYDDASRSMRRHKPVMWDAALYGAVPTADFKTAAADDAARMDLYRAIRDYGIIHVTGGEAAPGFIKQVAGLVGELSDAAYGQIFDLAPKSKIRTMGNTTRPVPPHTDEPFRFAPPGIFVLSCVRAADDGGDTVLVDGFKLAETLREEDREAFDLLCTQNQSFVRVHEGTLDERARVPTFALDDAGSVVGVRIHTRSQGPLDLPPNRVEPFYAAYHRLTQLMMDPAFQIRIPLAPGDSVIVDNHRILHARTHFSDPERFLQTCNVARESFHERLRLLAERLGYREEANLIMAAGAVC